MCTKPELDSRYIHQRLLGVGSAGKVFQARDNATGNAVAIKVLPKKVVRGWCRTGRICHFRCKHLTAPVPSARRHPACACTSNSAHDDLLTLLWYLWPRASLPFILVGAQHLKTNYRSLRIVPLPAPTVAQDQHELEVQKRALVNEAGIMMAVEEHPQALRVHAIHQDDSSFCIVTDLCEGGELFNHISSSTVRPRIAAKLLGLAPKDWCAAPPVRR